MRGGTYRPSLRRDAGEVVLVDGSLKLSAFQVTWNGAEIGPAELSGTLKDGKLETTVQDATLYGGKATAKITLDGAQDLPVLQLNIDALGPNPQRLCLRGLRRSALLATTICFDVQPSHGG